MGGSGSQLELPSLTPLSVADCGRLQLGVVHWATSVTFMEVDDNLPREYGKYILHWGILALEKKTKKCERVTALSLYKEEYHLMIRRWMKG